MSKFDLNVLSVLKCVTSSDICVRNRRETLPTHRNSIPGSRCIGKEVTLYIYHTNMPSHFSNSVVLPKNVAIEPHPLSHWMRGARGNVQTHQLLPSYPFVVNFTNFVPTLSEIHSDSHPPSSPKWIFWQIPTTLDKTTQANVNIKRRSVVLKCGFRGHFTSK